MKKILSLLIALVFCAAPIFALASCGETTPTAAPTAEPTAEPTAKPTSEPTAEPTAEPTSEPTAEPTTEDTTFDPSVPFVMVSLAINDEVTSDVKLKFVPVGGTAVFDLTFKRGLTFDYCDDPFAVYENGKLTLPEVYFDTVIYITTKADKKYDIRLNYPSSDIGDVHARAKNGDELGQYLPTDTTSAAKARYYMYGNDVITFSAAAKDGYKFIGWSWDNYAVRGGEIFSVEPTFTVAVSTDIAHNTNIYANFEKSTAIKVTYHANGGEYSGDGDTHEVNYTHPVYNYASTLGADLFTLFSRDGYVPIEYNTRADGTGTAISIGSKATLPGNAIDLYIIWAKISPADNFKYEPYKDGLKIVEYTGSEETVVIPETANGKNVIAIESYAFANIPYVKTVVITKNIRLVNYAAFSDMSGIETVYLYDSVNEIYNESFDNCQNFANLRMVAALHPVSASSYLGPFTQKYELLFKYSDRNVAVFLGGSSMYNGFDGEYVYNALGGEYMPINLGLNRQITTVAMVELLSHLLDNGDMIVMAPELVGAYVDRSANLDISRWMWMAIESCYDIFRYLDIRYYTVFNGYTEMMSYTNKSQLNKTGKAQTYDYFTAVGTDLANKDTTTLSHGASADKYGNIQAMHFAVSSSTSETRNHVASSASMPLYIAGKLNALNAVLSKNGVTMYFTFCPMSEVKVNFTEAQSNAFADYLRSVLDFEVLGTPMRYVFDDALLDNHSVHLSNAGATERCRRLCEDILAH